MGGAAPQHNNTNHAGAGSSNTTTSDRVEKGAELRERPEADRDRADRDGGRGKGERRWNEPNSNAGSGGGGGGSMAYGQGRDREDRDRQGGGSWKRSSDRPDREFGRERDRERGGERVDRREFGSRGVDRDRPAGETESAERFAAAFGRKGDGLSDRRGDRMDGGGRGSDRSMGNGREYRDSRDRERDRDERDRERGGDWGPRSHTDGPSRFSRHTERRTQQEESERRGEADREAGGDEQRDGFGLSRQPSNPSASTGADGSAALDESDIARLEAKYGPAAGGSGAYSREAILALFQPSSPPDSLQAVPPELGLVSAVCLQPVLLSESVSDGEAGPFWLSSKGSWHAKRHQPCTLGRRQYSGGSATHSLGQSHAGALSDRSTPAWFDQPVASILEDEQAVVMTNERVERERTDRRMERERLANAAHAGVGSRHQPEHVRAEADGLNGWSEAEQSSQHNRAAASSTLSRSSAPAGSHANGLESPPPALPRMPASPPSLSAASSAPLGGGGVAAVLLSQWYYKDPQDEVQGPFSGGEMRDWYTKGYFDLKLRVACTHSTDTHSAAEQRQQLDDGHFIPLGVWFNAGKKAFLDQVPTLTHEQPAHAARQPAAQLATHSRPPPPQPHHQPLPQQQRAALHTPQRAFAALRLVNSDSDPRQLDGALHGNALYSALQHDDQDDMARLADASLHLVDDDSNRQAHMQPLYGRQQPPPHPAAAIGADGGWSLAHGPPYPPHVSARLASPLHTSAAPGMGWPLSNFSPHHPLATASPRSAALTTHSALSPFHSSAISGTGGMLHEQIRQAAAATPLVQAGRPHPTAQQALPSSFVSLSPSHSATERVDDGYAFHLTPQSAREHRPTVQPNEQLTAAQKQQQAIALARERLLQQQQQQQQQQQRQQQQRMADNGSVWISSPQQLREREEALRRQQQQQQLAEKEEAERRQLVEEQKALEALQMEREGQRKRESDERAAQLAERARQQHQQHEQQQRMLAATAHSSAAPSRVLSGVPNAASSSQAGSRWPSAGQPSSAATSQASRVLSLSEVQALEAEEAAARAKEDREDARRQQGEYEEEKRAAAAAAAAAGSSVWKAGATANKASSSRSLADIMAEEAQQSQSARAQQQQQQQLEQQSASDSPGADGGAWQQDMAARMKTAQQNAASVWGVSQLPTTLTPVPQPSPASTAARVQPPSNASTPSPAPRGRTAAEEPAAGASASADKQAAADASGRRSDGTSKGSVRAAEYSRRKATAAVERSQAQAAAVWGAHTPAIDLRAIQQQEAEASRLAEARAELRAREQQLAAAQSTVLGSVWGGLNPLTQNVPPSVAPTAAASKAAGRGASSSSSPSAASVPLSLKDIQAMEAQATQSSASSPGRGAGGIVPAASAGVWSSVTSGGSTNTASSKKSSAQPAATIRMIDEPDDIWGYSAHTTANAAAANSAAAPAAGSGQTKQSKAAGGSGKAASSSAAARSAPTASSSSSAASAFGVDVAMSADFSAWCRTQLNQITGSSDLTLAHYLLSLDSPQLVEETCVTYLGAGEQVRRFAHDFLANAQFDRQGQSSRIGGHNSSGGGGGGGGGRGGGDRDGRKETEDSDKKKRGKRR